MGNYGDELIDAVADRLMQFKGRMLFFDDRQEVAREMVARNLFDAAQLIEKIDLYSDDKLKTVDWPSGYVKFCVNWLSQTDEPAEKLLAIALNTKMDWHIRREAFECIGDLPSKDSLNEKQWQQVAKAIRPERKGSQEYRQRPLWAVVDLRVTSVYPVLHSMLESCLLYTSDAADE